MNQGSRNRMERMYYRVLATGPVGNGPIKASPEDAWRAWDRMALREWCHGGESALGSAYAAMSARLAVATTRHAAEEADVSLGGGRVAKGEWWISSVRIPHTKKDSGI